MPQVRTVGREIAVFGFFLLLAIVFTWPLALRLSTGTSDLGDPLLNAWIIDWDLYAATHAPSSIYQAPIFYPGKYPLAYSENLFGIALVAFPFYLAGCSPLFIYNLMFIGGFAFSAYGGYVLARTATGSMRAGLIAGVLYGFVPFRFDHMPHLQIVFGGWLPLILAALLHYWKRSTWWTAAGFGGALLMNGLTNIHYFLFGTLTAAVTIFVLAFVAPHPALRATLSPLTRGEGLSRVPSPRLRGEGQGEGWRFWLRLAVAAGLAVALMIPVLWPYKVVSELYKMKRQQDEVFWGSATWTDWLTPPWASKTYGDLIPAEKTAPERHLFPGLFVLFLTAVAFVLYGNEERDPSPSSRLRVTLRAMDVAIVALAIVSYWGAISPKYVFRLWNVRIVSVDSSDLPLTILIVLIFIRLWLRRPLAWRQGLSRLPIAFWMGCLWIAIGLLGSFGVHGFLHGMLYRRIEAFQSIRVPARWAGIVYVGLAVTAGFGALALIRRKRFLAFPVLLAIAIFDMRPRVRWEHTIAEIDPVYRWLHDAPFRGAILELPIEEGSSEFLYLQSHTFHHRSSLNGTSGFEPPSHWHLRELSFQKSWGPEMTAYIARLGCTLVVVHDDWLRTQGDKVHDWLRHELASGRLIFVRQFDHRIGGDFVFAVRATCPDCARLRPPDHPDAARLLPDQNLDRMLSNQPIYLARTFGLVDFPREERVGKTLTVSGWALSPSGIRGVDILLNSGTKRYAATLTARGDVQAKFPWYPQVKLAGYTITIPKRPHGVPKYTDMQVEIIDGSGGRTRLPDKLIEW